MTGVLHMSHGVTEQVPVQDPAQDNAPFSSGLYCLAAALKARGADVTVRDVIQAAGTAAEISAVDLIRVGEVFGAAPRLVKSSFARLPRFPFPLIAERRDGSFILLLSADDSEVRFLEPTPGGGIEGAADGVEFASRWTGRLIVPTGTEADLTSQDGHGLIWLLRQGMKEKALLAQIGLSSVLLQVFALVTPLVTMMVIDKVLSTGNLSTLDVLILAVIGLAVFDLVIGMARKVVLQHVSNRLDVQLASRLHAHLVRLPLAWFALRPAGETAARAKELDSVRAFLTGPALSTLVDLPFTLIFLGVMLLFSPMLTAIVAAAIGLVLVLYGVIGRELKQRLTRKTKSHAESHSLLVETISAIETVKSQALEADMHRQWEDAVVSHSRLAGASESLSATLSQIANFVTKATVALCLWIGAQAVIDGHLTAGQLIAFNMMVGRVLAPAMRLGMLWQQVNQTRVAMARLGEVLNQAPEPSHAPHVAGMPQLAGQIRFENVTFRYSPDGPAALEEVSFDIPQGQVVGIVGTSGAGKTSMIKLLLRLYAPAAGRVLVDGVNIAQINPHWLRRQIAVVMQDAVLLNRSVRANIAARDPGASMQQIQQAAQLAGADEFIRALPQAYDTVVGERGAMLSAGQRQRLALAQALLSNPRILVLDEATSALDLETEAQIHKNLKQICAGRTVLIVAHRLSSLRYVDRVLSIEHGRIIEDGAPQDLVARKGKFARLVKLAQSAA